MNMHIAHGQTRRGLLLVAVLAVVGLAVVAAAMGAVVPVRGATSSAAAATGAATIWKQTSTQITASGDSGPLTVPAGKGRNLTLGVTLTALAPNTNSGDSFELDYLGPDGEWYAAGSYTQNPDAPIVSFLIPFGPGSVPWNGGGCCFREIMASAVSTNTVRVRWALLGNTTSMTFSGFLIGR